MKNRTNLILLAFALVFVAYFFMNKACNVQKENISLSEKYELLEQNAEDLKNKIFKSDETVSLQKEYIDKLLAVIRKNKGKLDAASNEELAELENKYANLNEAYNDLAKGGTDIGDIEDFESFAESRNQKQKSELKSYENQTRILRDSIKNNNKIIASLNTRIQSLEKIVQNKDIQINELTLKIKALDNDIIKYNREHKEELEKNARERKAELDKIVETGKNEKNELVAQNDSLKNDRNSLNERNKKLEEQIPGSTILSVKYVNSKGELVELRGSNNKKSNKNIEEIFVSFNVNTEKYKGDVKFELTLRCVECKNPSKCPNIPIIDRAPIAVISKEKIWSECKQSFKPTLSRYCKYKISVQHGSENVFPDEYIFVTDGYDK